MSGSNGSILRDDLLYRWAGFVYKTRHSMRGANEGDIYLVGASLLAKVVNDYVEVLTPRSVFRFFREQARSYRDQKKEPGTT
ncbi:hypothetical protein EMIT0P218_120028 [Pseudomonas sp. IT-P218]